MLPENENMNVSETQNMELGNDVFVKEADPAITTSRVASQPRISQIQQRLLHTKLEKFRADPWTREGLKKPLGQFSKTCFLQDKHIESLVRGAGNIDDLQSIARILGREKLDL
jgi:hypothetical protein